MSTTRNGIPWVRYLVFALSVPVYFACTIYLVEHVFGVGLERDLLRTELIALPLAFLTLFTIIFASAVVHECGHAIAGLCAGVVVLSVRVWPFEVVRRHRGVRIESARRRKPPKCAIGVPAPGRDVHRQMFWFSLGGPLANLLVLALAGGVDLLLVVSGLPEYPLLRVIVGVNAYMGVANLLPIGRASPSDGTRVYRALRRSMAEDDIECFRYAHSQLTQGEPTSPAPATLLRWESSTQPLLRGLALSIAFDRAVAEGSSNDVNAAYERLVMGLRELGKLPYASCAAFLARATFEVVFGYCLQGGDPTEAEKRLSSLGWMRRLAPHAQDLRVQAALARRRGDNALAQRLHQQALDEAAGEFSACGRQREIARLDQLGARLFADAAVCAA